MRRTHPLRQPSADTSPNSMGELAPLGESFYFNMRRVPKGKAFY